MKITPLAGYILIEPQEGVAKTESGIFIPEASQEKPAQGTVVATGGTAFIDNRELKCPVKAGEQVVYKKWGGDEIKIDNKDFKLVRFDDLMAVLQ